MDVISAGDARGKDSLSNRCKGGNTAGRFGETDSPMWDRAGSGHKTSRKSGLKATWGQVEKGLEIQADTCELWTIKQH